MDFFITEKKEEIFAFGLDKDNGGGREGCFFAFTEASSLSDGIGVAGIVRGNAGAQSSGITSRCRGECGMLDEGSISAPRRMFAN